MHSEHQLVGLVDAIAKATQWWIDDRVDKLLPLDFVPDREVVLKNIEDNAELYVRLPSALRQDDQIVTSVLNKAPDMFPCVATSLQHDTKRAQQHLLRLIKLDPQNILHAGSLLYDSELLLTAVRQDGRVFQHLDHQRRSDAKLMLLACKTHRQAWQHASDQIVEQLTRMMTNKTFDDIYDVLCLLHKVV